MVHGTIDNQRADDQRGKLDNLIINQQNQNYKERIKNFHDNKTLSIIHQYLSISAKLIYRRLQ